jgi:AcrR family transcriptional regulator
MRPRGSYKKSETSRQQVLDAAVRTLAANGFAKTSIGDIAKAAGMSKGAVHYHFESKHDLIAQVLEHCAQIMRERVRAAWAGPAEPTEKVRLALAEMRRMRREAIPELRVLADMMAQGLHDEAIRSQIARLFEANRNEVIEHLVASLRELGLEPVLPTRIVPRLLLGVIDGMALHDFFDPPSPDDEQETQRALEMIAISMLRR